MAADCKGDTVRRQGAWNIGVRRFALGAGRSSVAATVPLSRVVGRVRPGPLETTRHGVANRWRLRFLAVLSDQRLIEFSDSSER